MNQTRALPWVIDILDDGLRLYRRYWSSFALATTMLLVPNSVFSLLVNTLVITQLGRGSGWRIVASLLVALVTVPLSIYAIAVLSRMAAQATSGATPNFQIALRMPVRRVLGMGCYTIVFALVSSLCFGMGGGVLLCISVGIMGRLLQRSLFGLSLGPFFALSIGIGLFAYLLVFSGVAMSTIYSLQAFALDHQSFGDAITQINDFLFYRLRRNLLCFITGGAIFATVITAYVGTIAYGALLLVQYLFKQPFFSQSLVTQAIVTVTGLVSTVILLPPMPIWMALLYLRIKAEREGGALEQRITAWAATSPQ